MTILKLKQQIENYKLLRFNKKIELERIELLISKYRISKKTHFKKYGQLLNQEFELEEDIEDLETCILVSEQQLVALKQKAS